MATEDYRDGRPWKSLVSNRLATLRDEDRDCCRNIAITLNERKRLLASVDEHEGQFHVATMQG